MRKLILLLPVCFAISLGVGIHAALASDNNPAKNVKGVSCIAQSSTVLHCIFSTEDSTSGGTAPTAYISDYYGDTVWPEFGYTVVSPDTPFTITFPTPDPHADVEVNALDATNACISTPDTCWHSDYFLTKDLSSHESGCCGYIDTTSGPYPSGITGFAGAADNALIGAAYSVGNAMQAVVDFWTQNIVLVVLSVIGIYMLISLLRIAFRSFGMRKNRELWP